jgi:hypothetical protein
VVVVDVAEGGWPVAALGGAACVAEAEGDPLGGGVETPLAADVEGLGLAAEDDRDDPGTTREPSGFAGGDLGAVAEPAAFRPPIRVSRSTVTTTVAETPPARGRV